MKEMTMKIKKTPTYWGFWGSKSPCHFFFIPYRKGGGCKHSGKLCKNNFYPSSLDDIKLKTVSIFWKLHPPTPQPPYEMFSIRVTRMYLGFIVKSNLNDHHKHTINTHKEAMQSTFLSCFNKSL